ncbi:FeoA family protein [Hyphococcus sp.]|uniref:FeoA family protein n=1 Tax=Hyphococcus sp. TaxID=2038636 RepID=UPI003D10798C
MLLSQMKKGAAGRVVAIRGDDPLIEAKLREIGFAEDDAVELAHLGPLAKTPICVRLNRTLIALRTDEADAIEVEVDR